MFMKHFYDAPPLSQR